MIRYDNWSCEIRSDLCLLYTYIDVGVIELINREWPIYVGEYF